MDNAITQKILFEIEQIDELINASSPLLGLCKNRDPDFVEKCGIALILQSFYSGIEKIMLLIIKDKDTVLPNGVKWHKDLLDNALKDTSNRTHIFRENLSEQLNDYLKFRHLVKHSYGFQLKWEKMKNILFDMVPVWKEIKEDVNIFIKNN